MADRSLSHFGFYTFTDTYWNVSEDERATFREQWLAGLRQAAQTIDIYQVFPARSDTDICVWSAVPIEEGCDTHGFFDRYARATNPHRRLIKPVSSLWGYTRPSQYTRGAKSEQEIDPFATVRKPYLVGYPFVKTKEWYLMSREARQGMMNEHIKVGHQHPDIMQLLLYSFGVQDQEFVVVYETDDLTEFSTLVNELRSTEARRYTERDTPLFTAMHHSPEDTLAMY